MKYIAHHTLMKSLIKGTFALSMLLVLIVPIAQAQVSAVDNPSSSGYKLAYCDGPAIPAGREVPANYVVCDFAGLVGQVQHLITAALVFGVFVALAGFLWIGYLLISGSQKNREDAKKIFPKIFWGFIIMLSAWFIVYQVLSWLSSNPAFTSLLKQ